MHVTDRRTDWIAVAYAVLSIASLGKNYSLEVLNYLDELAVSINDWLLLLLHVIYNFMELIQLRRQLLTLKTSLQLLSVQLMQYSVV